MNVKEASTHCVYLKTCEGERRVAVGFNLRVDVAAHVKQETYRGRVAVHCCEHEWRYTQFAAGT